MKMIAHSSVPARMPYVHLGYTAAGLGCGAPRSGALTAVMMIALGAVVMGAGTQAGAEEASTRRRVIRGVLAAVLLLLLLMSILITTTRP